MWNLISSPSRWLIRELSLPSRIKALNFPIPEMIITAEIVGLMIEMHFSRKKIALACSLWSHLSPQGSGA